MTTKVSQTFTKVIYIGGDLAVAKQVCREFCQRGLCVTVEPTTYIYTGGEELGVRVGLINYPRFPKDSVEIARVALELAGLLRERLCQHSFTIVGEEVSIWDSTREQ